MYSQINIDIHLEKNEYIIGSTIDIYVPINDYHNINFSKNYIKGQEIDSFIFVDKSSEIILFNNKKCATIRLITYYEGDIAVPSFQLVMDGIVINTNEKIIKSVFMDVKASDSLSPAKKIISDENNLIDEFISSLWEYLIIAITLLILANYLFSNIKIFILYKNFRNKTKINSINHNNQTKAILSKSEFYKSIFNDLNLNKSEYTKSEFYQIIDLKLREMLSDKFSNNFMNKTSNEIAKYFNKNILNYNQILKIINEIEYVKYSNSCEYDMKEKYIDNCLRITNILFSDENI